LKKICPECGKEFVARKDSQICCSRECSSKHRTIIEPRVCPICGKIFKPHQTRNSHQKVVGIYCSRECASKASSRRKEFVCKNCGEVFSVPESVAKLRPPSYCSEACRKEFLSKNKKTKALRMVSYIKKTCAFCGKEFEARPSEHKARFCSQECMLQWRSKVIRERFKDSDKKETRHCEWCGKEFRIYTCQTTNNRGRFCSRACKGAWICANAQNRVSNLEKFFIGHLVSVGLKFKTQYPVNHYSLDVAFPDKKIAVEIDGDYWHSLPRMKKKDKKKDSHLQSLGWKVIRIKENEINANPEEAAKRVASFVLEE